MTTTTTKKMASKAKNGGAKRARGKAKDLPPIPPTAKIVEIGGRECVIVPLDEYDDWLQDALLTVIAADRLKNHRDDAIPFEEAVARLDARKKRR